MIMLTESFTCFRTIWVRPEAIAFRFHYLFILRSDFYVSNLPIRHHLARGTNWSWNHATFSGNAHFDLRHGCRLIFPRMCVHFRDYSTKRGCVHSRKNIFTYVSRACLHVKTSTGWIIHKYTQIDKHSPTCTHTIRCLPTRLYFN